MSKTTKIILAIIGGAVVGGLGVCVTIWPTQNLIIASAQGLVALAVATITGFVITK